MQFSGERQFSLSPEAVYEKLKDARFLADAIPDGDLQGEATETQSVCRVRPGFSFVRGTLDVTITVQVESPNALKYTLFSKGVGASSEVVAQVQLAPDGSGTKAIWQAEVAKLGGLLKAVPSGLVRGAAQKVIEDLWKGIEAKLA